MMGILGRIIEHQNDKDVTKDFISAVVIVRTNDSLQATEISFLENIFYKMAKEINNDSHRFLVINGIEHHKGNITEKTECEMMQVVDFVKPALSVLGYRVFEKINPLEKSTFDSDFAKVDSKHILGTFS